MDLGKSGLKTVITVSDVSGKELVREEMVGETGLFEKQYDLSKQAKGTYLIKIQQADKVLIEKIIFQN